MEGLDGNGGRPMHLVQRWIGLEAGLTVEVYGDIDAKLGTVLFEWSYCGVRMPRIVEVPVS